MPVSNARLLSGAVGGALGSVAMKAVVRFADPNAFGLSSQTDARAARALFGEGLEQRRAGQIGGAIHYGFGILTGIAYAAVSERYPAFQAGRGTALGGGLWLLGSELAVSAGRLEDPSAVNGLSHVSALAAHVLYGLIVDACVRRAA